MGRLVVLGPGGKRLPHALAGRHGPHPLPGGHRKAGGLQELDPAPGPVRLLPEPARHLPGALRGPDLGPRLRHGPHPRRLHPRIPVPRHRRLPGPLRLAHAGGLRRRALRPAVPGELPAGQQPAADGLRHPRPLRHPGPPDLRGHGLGQDLRGLPLVQQDVSGPPALPGLVPGTRPPDPLETRRARPARQGAVAPRSARGDCRRHGRCLPAPGHRRLPVGRNWGWGWRPGYSSPTWRGCGNACAGDGTSKP